MAGRQLGHVSFDTRDPQNVRELRLGQLSHLARMWVDDGNWALLRLGLESIKHAAVETGGDAAPGDVWIDMPDQATRRVEHPDALDGRSVDAECGDPAAFRVDRDAVARFEAFFGGNVDRRQQGRQPAWQRSRRARALLSEIEHGPGLARTRVERPQARSLVEVQRHAVGRQRTTTTDTS